MFTKLRKEAPIAFVLQANLPTDLLDAGGFAAGVRCAIPVGSKARTGVPLWQERVVNHNRRKEGDSDNC
jgi:hypothetical protein